MSSCISTRVLTTTPKLVNLTLVHHPHTQFLGRLPQLRAPLVVIGHRHRRTRDPDPSVHFCTKYRPSDSCRDSGDINVSFRVYRPPTVRTWNGFGILRPFVFWNSLEDGKRKTLRRMTFLDGKGCTGSILSSLREEGVGGGTNGYCFGLCLGGLRNNRSIY